MLSHTHAPQGAAIGALVFGLIAAPVGALTDFTRSTVYKAAQTTEGGHETS